MWGNLIVTLCAMRTQSLVEVRNLLRHKDFREVAAAMSVAIVVFDAFALLAISCIIHACIVCSHCHYL